jgi:hypothetical protein
LVLSCLEKEPVNRPQSIKGVEQRLREIAQRLSYPLAPAPLLSPHLSQWWTDKRRWAPAAGAIVVLVAGIGALVHRSNGAVARRAAAARAPATSAAPSAPLPLRSSSPLSPPPSSPFGAPSPPTARPRVEIAFDSNPRGAAVFRAGQAKPLGTTPFSARMEVSPGLETFEFRSEGRQPVRRQLALQKDAQIEVVLGPMANETAAPPQKQTPAVPGEKTKTRSRQAKLDHGSVFDPFE